MLLFKDYTYPYLWMKMNAYIKRDFVHGYKVRVSLQAIGNDLKTQEARYLL